MKMKQILDKVVLKLQSEGLTSFLDDSEQYVRNRAKSKVENSMIYQDEFLFNLCTEIRHRWHRFRYIAPAPPWRPIWINPADINYKNNIIMRGVGLGIIKGGEWDQNNNLTPVEDYFKYKGMKQHFLEGMDWESTVYYEHVKNSFERDGSRAGYGTLEEFRDKRLQYIDTLFESIKNEGYRPNFEASHNVPEVDDRNEQYDQQLEPLVVIGRKGDIYIHDGWHRFFIARELGIDPIPVNVLARHRRWQVLRDEVFEASDRSELSSDIQTYVDHPDMHDLL